MKKSILTDGEVMDSLLFLDAQQRDFRELYNLPGNTWHVFLFISDRWRKGTRIVNRHYIENSGIEMQGSEISFHLHRLAESGLLRLVLKGGRSYSYSLTVKGLDFLRFLEAELQSRIAC